MHDSYCLYSISHSAMVEISVMLISTILRCDIILLLFLLLFLYMFNIFLYVYGPCVCNKDILLLLLLLIDVFGVKFSVDTHFWSLEVYKLYSLELF